MADNYINKITIDSFGYDFYQYKGVTNAYAEIGVTFSVSADAIKFAVISTGILSSLQSSVSILENADFYVAEEIDSIFDVQSGSTKFAVIAAGIVVNIITEANVSPTVVLEAAANIATKFSINVYSVDVFSDSITEDSSSIKAFYILDNMPLSEHNRITSSITQILNSNNTNWRGLKSVYYKKNGVKKNFSLQWRMLPGKRENTVDNNFGRDFISTKASEPFAHILQIRNLDTDGTTPYTTEVYNVLITDYSETLIRRDLVGDDYYWDCNLSLQEV